MNDHLKRALSHPKRVAILSLLTQGSDRKGASKEEMAEVLDAGFSLVEYHLKVLHDAELVANVDGASEKGASQARYVATSSF